MNDEHTPTCPNCGSENVKKVFSAGAGILFKGNGFYCTDYKNKKDDKKETSCCSNGSDCKCSGGKHNKQK